MPTDRAGLSGSTSSGLPSAYAANRSGCAAASSRQPACDRAAAPGEDGGGDVGGIDAVVSDVGAGAAGADDAGAGGSGAAGEVADDGTADGDGNAGDGVAPPPPSGTRLVLMRAHDPSGSR